MLPTLFFIHPSLYLMNHSEAARYFASTSFVAFSDGLAPLLPCQDRLLLEWGWGGGVGGGGLRHFMKDAIRRLNKALSRLETRTEAEA